MLLDRASSIVMKSTPELFGNKRQNFKKPLFFKKHKSIMINCKNIQSVF